MRPSNDKEAITLILQGLVAAGHTIVSVIDDTWNKDDKTYTSDVDEAVDLITGVDEGFVLLRTKDSDDPDYMDDAWIYFVLGNDPEEVACNYTVNLDPDLSNITDPWWNR